LIASGRVPNTVNTLMRDMMLRVTYPEVKVRMG